MELRPDAVVAGKLRLLRPLGEGGMGVVWAARHLTLDSDVAVKLVRPERVASDPGLVARFEREARTLAKIAHPNVVRIMDFGTEHGVPFIVMELLEGFSLAELFRQGGRLSLGSTRSLLQQAGAALAAAHESGIVHRDIKPQNIFVTSSSSGQPLTIKVLDFGVAKLLESTVPLASGALTESGVIVGSAPYMSPEQLEGKRDVDFRSDLWSLGVIVYEALTGQRPFLGTSFVTVGAAVLRGEYRPVSDFRPGLPAAVDAWMARALCPDPAGRVHSAQEMIATFPHDEDPRHALTLTVEHSADRADLASTTVDHVPAALKPPRKVSKAHVLAALAAVGVLSLGLLGLSSGMRDTHCPSGMVLIPGARFEMGSRVAADTPSDETTAGGALNLVRVDDFCMDTTEVTVAAYARCKGCTPPRNTVEFEGLTPNGRRVESQFCNGSDSPDQPINCVDWQEASHFCQQRGARLPNEAEWEYAARGLDARSYPWGNTRPSAQRLNACGSECRELFTTRLGTERNNTMYDQDDTAAATAPVGRFPEGATDRGLLDLAGNVWEWTQSPYCAYPFKADAQCGDSRRVLRGGGWDTTEILDVRAARRYPASPNARGKSVGFRCARDL